MIEIEKRYILDEVKIKVNNRMITYDKPFERAIYTYNGINKEEFKINYAKWNKIACKKVFICSEDGIYIDKEDVTNDR